jgi:hypothetical protein
MEDSIDAIFREADEARRELAFEQGTEALDVDADEAELFVNASHKIRKGEPVFTTNDRGDVHACFGLQCAHVSLTHENQYVCSVSGQVVGIKHTEESDPGWTGRSTGSANPDDSAGTPVGGWIKRRDMWAASVAAFRYANQMCNDAEMLPMPMAPPPAPAPAIKRGALCVDESPDENVAPKKPRTSRKENWTSESLEKLAAEANSVIGKLFIANPKPRAEEEGPLDPRLQNLEFVRALAIRKYVKQCADGESELNLDVLGNVIIHANEFVRDKREQASKRLKAAAERAKAKTQRTDAAYSGQIRNQLSRLIVSLWRASCLTKHFLQSKKGGDSFRPFASGILYSLKRGLYLPDGTCVVPVLNELATYLPALRSASSTPAAKQLQSSSHKGICSIQRALASISEMTREEALPARTLLRDAARQGAFLRELVSRNS